MEFSLIKAEIIAGTRFACGTILGPAGSDKSGNRLCVFICAICPGGNTTRYTEIVSGKVKSCGCLKRRNCIEHYNRLAASVPLPTRRLIFTTTKRMGKAAAGASRGLDKILVDHIVRLEWTRLSGYDLPTTTKIYKYAQRAVRTAALEFDLTVTEVLAICFMHKASTDQAEADQLAGWLALSDDERNEAISVINEARTQIEEAIEIAGDIDMQWDRDKTTGEIADWHKGRYKGELTREELSTNEKSVSEFRWIYSALKLIPGSVNKACFGTIGLRFLELCDSTLRSRHSRRVARIKDLRAGKPPLNKKPTVRPITNSLRFQYSSEKAAKLFNSYAQNNA